MPHVDDKYLLFVFAYRETEVPEHLVNKVGNNFVETRKVFKSIIQKHKYKRDKK